jgi:hypothetical protein
MKNIDHMKTHIDFLIIVSALQLAYVVATKMLGL